MPGKITNSAPMGTGYALGVCALFIGDVNSRRPHVFLSLELGSTFELDRWKGAHA